MTGWICCCFFQVVTVLYIKTVQINEQENTPPSVQDDPKRAASAMENQDFINRKRRDTKRISGSGRMTIIYCMILLAAAIAWFTLGAKSHGISADRNGSEYFYQILYRAILTFNLWM